MIIVHKEKTSGSIFTDSYDQKNINDFSKLKGWISYELIYLIVPKKVKNYVQTITQKFNRTRDAIVYLLFTMAILQNLKICKNIVHKNFREDTAL